MCEEKECLENQEESSDNNPRVGLIWLRGDVNEEMHENFMNQFCELLQNNNIDIIQVCIDSKGGSHFIGISIYEEIRLSPKPVITIAQGAAFSSAAVILQAGTHRVATKNSRIMIHLPCLVLNECMLNTKDLESMIKSNQRLDQELIALISKKSKKSKKEWKEILDKEENLYFNARQAKKIGLIDKII